MFRILLCHGTELLSDLWCWPYKLRLFSGQDGFLRHELRYMFILFLHLIFNHRYRGPHDDLLVGKDLKPAAKRPKLETNQEKEFEEFIHDDTDYYKSEVRVDNTKNYRNPKEKAKPKNSLEKGNKCEIDIGIYFKKIVYIL